MEMILVASLFFLDLLFRNLRCLHELADLAKAKLNGYVTRDMYNRYVAAALEYLQGTAKAQVKTWYHLRKDCLLKIGEKEYVATDIWLDEHRRVIIKTKCGKEMELAARYCIYDLVVQLSDAICPAQWDEFVSPRAVCFRSGIPLGAPDVKAITDPEFSIDTNAPAFTTDPAHTLYNTLFCGMIPSLQEMMALMETICGFREERMIRFDKPVCVRIFAGVKKLKHMIYGICFNEAEQLAPMDKKGKPLPVLLEDCPAYVFSDVFYAVLQTAPLKRYTLRNRLGAVKCLKGGEADNTEDYNQLLDQFIQEAFELLEQDMRIAKAHPEMSFLLKKELRYDFWYLCMYKMADNGPVTIQDGITLQGFSRDFCPLVMYYGVLGYLPLFEDATTGFILRMLQGPLKVSSCAAPATTAPNLKSLSGKR